MFTKTQKGAALIMVAVGIVSLIGYAGNSGAGKKASDAFVDANGDGICDNRNTCTNACQAGQAACQGQGQGACRGKGPCRGNKRCEGSR